jgi:tetratricopeptide (TPR) repeat protein
MAEGLLGGVLGSEDEKPETEAPQALAGAEAFAAAVAARFSSGDPGVARKTEVFLDRQAELLELQAEHLRDEHALRLTHLAHQSHLLLGQRLGQLIRLAFQVVIALVVIVIGIGIAVMLHDAFTSHNVVIDAFDTPPALASTGTTGKVVAGDVLDELTRLQSATFGGPASGSKRSLASAWSNQVTVEVPETGVSLEELSQVLKARFGHDVHIGGALVQTDSGGLALTVRGDGVAAKTFTGASDALQRLTDQAAQYVYAQSEPALWGGYLGETGRCPEALTFIRSVYDRADPQFRPTLLYDEANCVHETGGPLSESMALLSQARAIDPDFAASSYLDEQTILFSVGSEEQAWRVGQKLGQLTPRMAPRTRGLFETPSHVLTRDYSSLRDWLVDALQAGESELPGAQMHYLLAVAQVALHDPDAAELALWNAPQVTPGDRTVEETVGYEADERTVAYVRGLIAEERGDSATAVEQMDAASAGVVNPLDRNGYGLLNAYGLFVPGPGCAIAPIEEAGGHPEKADAILASPAAAHFTDCQRFRGDILDHRGDWAGAQQAYAAAVALAPDLPASYYSWGVALARHGDLAGAIAKLQAANQRGPHWADPLKAWGDVLAKQGRWKDALEKYDEALKYAPNWAALKAARAAMAQRG